MTKNTVVQIKKSVLFREVGADVHCFSLDGVDVFKIDGIAARIFLEFDGKKSLEQILTSQIKKAKISSGESASFRSDAASFVAELLQRDLIVVKTKK